MQVVERTIVCDDLYSGTGFQQCRRMKLKYGQTRLQLLLDIEAIIVSVQYAYLFPAGQKLRVMLDVGDHVEYLLAGVGQLH
jgi:hypothetical protein